MDDFKFYFFLKDFIILYSIYFFTTFLQCIFFQAIIVIFLFLIQFYPGQQNRFGHNAWRGGRGHFQWPFRGRGTTVTSGPFPRHSGPSFNPSSIPPPPPRGSNLIVINTLPAEGEEQESFSGNAGLCTSPQRGLSRGGGCISVGRNNNLLPAESSSKPVLLRPQDKYCSSSDTTPAIQTSVPEKRKKKGQLFALPILSFLKFCIPQFQC